MPNLLGYDSSGARIWEAEFPRHSDYYYKVTSRTPLVAYSFSSYSCEIDPKSGKIKAKSFFK